MQRNVKVGSAHARDLPGAQVRADARASLAAGRNAALWWICAGVGVSIALVFVAGVSVGALVGAIGLVCAAIARAALRTSGPFAFAVRSRPLDVATLLVLAVGIGYLSQVIPVR